MIGNGDSACQISWVSRCGALEVNRGYVLAHCPPPWNRFFWGCQVNIAQTRSDYEHDSYFSILSPMLSRIGQFYLFMLLLLRFFLIVLVGTLLIFWVALITAVLSNMLAWTQARHCTFGRTHTVGCFFPSSLGTTCCSCNMRCRLTCRINVYNLQRYIILAGRWFVLILNLG